MFQHIAGSIRIDREMAKNIKEWLGFIIFFIGAPVTAHFLFSWIGFNPTDDGFTLAYSRRILLGQTPHRDFIIIRPFLSPLLHTPFVLWGGAYTFWVSRLFIWFQFAAIAWAWTSVINRLLKKPFSALEQFIFALVGMAFCAHDFPMLAWHTVDGLFLSSLGLRLCISDTSARKFAGYALIASACLCKQSFLFIAPITVFVLGDWKKKSNWAAIFLPGALYLLFLLASGAFHDAVIQLSSHTEIFRAGFRKYFKIPFTWLGLLAGILLMRLTAKYLESEQSMAGQKSRRAQSLTFLSYGLLILGAALTIGITRQFPGLRQTRIFYTSFGLFGIMVGIFLYFCWARSKESVKYWQASVLIGLTAWSVSLSVGYNSPVLASGPMIVFLAALAFNSSRQKAGAVRTSFAIMAAAAALFSFEQARMKNVYREKPASDLTFNLDEVFPGAKQIRTNANTYRFLADLQKAIKIAEGYKMKYAVIPDLAGYWVKAGPANPLPLDWANRVELNSPKLIERTFETLKNNRDKFVVIVQKVKAEDLNKGFKPLPDEYSPAVQFVKTFYEKTSETEFFEIYRQKTPAQ